MVYSNLTNGLIDIKKLIKKVKNYYGVGKLSFISDYKIFDINLLSNGIYYLSIEYESGKIEKKYN
jgi:hypothetical protein